MTITNDSPTTESQSTAPSVWFDDSGNGGPGDHSIREIQRITIEDHGIDATHRSEADCWHVNGLPFQLDDVRTLSSASVPVIVSIHGSYRSWASRRRLVAERDFVRLWRRVWDRVSSRLSTVMVYTTESARQAGEKAGIPSDRTRVIPLGYDRDRFRDTVSTETDDPFILCVTNHDHPRKNIPRILETMRRSERQFVCVGSAWEHHAGETPSNATVTGYIPEEELIDYYNRATALYLPSLFEGFGLPIVEAMACGTPVVTTDHGAMAEVSGRGGVHVSPTDVTAHIATLEDLLTDREYRLTREERARERATEFSWRRTSEMYARLYREVAT